MKRLILVRHGKSSWEHDVKDHERPLKKRAITDAQLVTKAFKNVFQKPATLWSSSAVRALETAKIFKKELAVEDENFLVKDALYTFDARELLQIIATCSDSVEQLMIFGHNPATTQVVNSLGDQNFDNIPTTGLSVIDFKLDSWKSLKRGKTILYLFPKNLQ